MMEIQPAGQVPQETTQEVMSWTKLELDQLEHLAENEILDKTRSGPIGLPDELYRL